MDYLFHYPSPLGAITMAADGTALTGLWFDGQKYFAAGLSADAKDAAALPVFSEAVRWLDLYFAGVQPNFLPPLRPRGSDFRQKVWKLLMEIPYGKTATYGQLGKQLAFAEGLQRMSAQAVGGAVGHNPISLMIPCHRVVGADGSLTGYAGGIDRKLSLLKLEQKSISFRKNGTVDLTACQWCGN